MSFDQIELLSRQLFPSSKMERPQGLPKNPAQGRRGGAASAKNSGPPTVVRKAPPPPLTKRAAPLPSSKSVPPLPITKNVPLPPPIPPPPPTPPPLPALRETFSNPALGSNPLLSPRQVIALAKEALKAAIDESETQVAEATGAGSNDLRPGLTIDLSRKYIRSLPDEVVDIIKNELERLALSHNYLQSFPARFGECQSLRYLNVRQNKIKDFPIPLCDLRSLEILDLGRNKLRVLPPDIVKLSSLKVLAVQKNMITELPLCLADMASLQVLKLDGNPIVFPPPEIFQIQASSPPNDGFLKESEVTEVTVTAHIKRFLKQRLASLNGRSDADTTGDESSEGTETPRLPIKRVMSGRFPIRVPNGPEAADVRSPNLVRPPPIPTRSHYRGLSQQNMAMRRPGVMPLTIGNVNERVRSNSETLVQASRPERPESRNRRMGVVSKKSELGTLDETQANNRFSYYRGLSHGSAMQGPGTSMVVKSPASPGDPLLQRPVYIRRLSVLPERRRESSIIDPVLESAKGVLYSVFQIHPMIQMLLGLTSDGTTKRSSLELVFYNTTLHVEELELEIQRHDLTIESGAGSYENENVQSACVTLVNAYAHVCSLLASNVDLFINNGDSRYIRTLLTQLYNSIMELRVTCTQVSTDDGYRRAATRAAISDTIRPRSRESSVTPTAERPFNSRSRNGTFSREPSSLRVATDVPVPAIPYINGSGRTATIMSATPRSGESYGSSNNSSGRGLTGDFTDEDRLFERIFLSLQKSSELIIRTLPNLNVQFSNSLRSAMAQRAPDEVTGWWKVLLAECTRTIQQTEVLKNRLSQIKLKEPGIRSQASFWAICQNFLDAWAELGSQIKASTSEVPLALPMDMKTRLRPIQQSIKETTTLIYSSPWSEVGRQSITAGGMTASATSPYRMDPGSGGHQLPLPVTPQSAALGPAVQATVATPQSASFASAFSGNVFERAGALINNGGLSMSSRSGTMNSSSTSINSTFSSQDGSITPTSMLSPGQSFQQPAQPPFRR